LQDAKDPQLLQVIPATERDEHESDEEQLGSSVRSIQDNSPSWVIL
jgi:hypothetical protein